MISLGAVEGRCDPRWISFTSPIECDASTGNGMSMADDNPRCDPIAPNDPYRRGDEPSRPNDQRAIRWPSLRG